MPSELRKQRDQERTEKRRLSLLESASRVFARQGYHRTLISDIVNDAGVGQGTFYRHFKDKRQIFEALFELLLQKVAAQFQDMESRPPQSAEEFRSASRDAYRRMAQVLDQNRDLASLLLREGRTIDAEFQRTVEGVFLEFAQLAQSFLDLGVARGFARPMRTDIVAQAIVGLVIALADSWWAGRFPGVDIDTLVDESVALAFDGMIAIPNTAQPS